MPTNPGRGRRTPYVLYSIVIALAPGCSSTPDVPLLTDTHAVSDTGSTAAPSPSIDSTGRVKPDTGTVKVDSATVKPDTSHASPSDSTRTQADTTRRADTVVVPYVVTLQVTPAASTLLPGATDLVTASATMSDGRVTPGIPVSWSATGGSIASSGLFTAGGSPGLVSIVAVSGTVRGVATITIAAPLPAVSTLVADDFVNSIGVNVHLGYFSSPYGTGWQGTIVPRLSELGVRHVRDGGTIVSDDGWMNSVYGRMQQLASLGIHFDLVLSPAQGNTDYTSYTSFARLMQFAGPAVECFEGLNEHDLSGRTNWVAEVRSFQPAMFAAIRGNSSTAAMQIYGPSMGHPVNAAAVGDLSRYVDLGSVHPYPGGRQPMAALADAESRVAAIDGSHPWAVTETGYHNAMASNTDNPPVSEAAAGRYIPRLLLGDFLVGVQRTYLYELIDEGTDQTNREQNFGLLRADGSEKPAFVAIRNLIALLTDRGARFTPTPLRMAITGNVTGVESAVFAKRNGSYDVVLWQEVASYNLTTKQDIAVPDHAVTLQFQGAPTLRIFIPMLSNSPQPGGGRGATLTVNVPDHPIVIEVTP
ncbi:MAG TPA: hypothetical protein VGL65_02515 [Gemmatimonadales bacterium]